MLIRRAEVEGALCDVRLDGGRIVELGASLDAADDRFTLEAGGGALLPGLHDHHIHLFALAAALRSVGCGPPSVRNAEELEAVLAAAPPREWIRGVGYHESVAGELDRVRLDRLVRDRPVRIQHRSGALWMLNSAAVARLGLDAGETPPGVERDEDGRVTGRVFRLDAWLRERIGTSAPPDLAPVGNTLARFGVTGVTDATAGNGAAELDALGAALERGALRQRLLVMGRPELPAPAMTGVERSAVKLILEERDLPPLETLVGWLADAHQAGRSVSVHCVTLAELVVALGAFRSAGSLPGDRIEHGAVAPPQVVRLLAELGLTVVTQPHFVRERGDAYLEDVDERDLPWLYRAAGFVEGGVPLGGGTDAPFGDPDPWLAMRAAVERRTEAGAVLGEEESLTPERALALFTTPPEEPGGQPRRVEVGAPADLCLLARPWSEAREELSSEHVAATLRNGELTWKGAAC